MRFLLPLSVVLLAAATVPAAAEPRTIVCGPFSIPVDRMLREVGPLTFIVDIADHTAQVVEPSGKPKKAELADVNDHKVSIQFYSSDLMSNLDTYVVGIDNNGAFATLANYIKGGTPLSKASCRPSARIVF